MKISRTRGGEGRREPKVTETRRDKAEKDEHVSAPDPEPNQKGQDGQSLNYVYWSHQSEDSSSIYTLSRRPVISTVACRWRSALGRFFQSHQITSRFLLISLHRIIPLDDKRRTAPVAPAESAPGQDIGDASLFLCGFSCSLCSGSSPIDCPSGVGITIGARRRRHVRALAPADTSSPCITQCMDTNRKIYGARSIIVQ